MSLSSALCHERDRRPFRHRIEPAAGRVLYSNGAARHAFDLLCSEEARKNEPDAGLLLPTLIGTALSGCQRDAELLVARRTVRSASEPADKGIWRRCA